MRKLIIGAILLLITVAGIFLLSPQLYAYLIVKVKFSKNPIASATLSERIIKTSKYDVNNSEPISYNKINSIVPFKEISNETNSERVFLKFPKEKELILFGYPSGLKGSFVANAQDKEKLRYFFGEDALKNTFNFEKLILNSSPSNIKLFMPSKELFARYILIVLKISLTIPITDEGVVYSFESSSGIKGFQYGNPNKSKLVVIEIFDSNDNVYQIILKNFTQDEIDLVLSSAKIGQ